MKAIFKISYGCIFNISTLLILGLMISCSPSRYVPENSFLLNKNKLIIEQKKIDKSDLEAYLLQKPNKRILGIRLNLFYYNLSNINKTRWPHSWLRKIGEEPVVYDPFLTNRTREQFKIYLENKGYYDARVRDSVRFKKDNAKVIYRIKPGEPLRIRNIRYLFEDTGIVSVILNDTVNSLIDKGMLFDKEKLQNERIRLEELMKQNGYYGFSKEYIYFNAEVVNDRNLVDLTFVIKEYVEGEINRRSMVRHHKKYKINDVIFYPNYNPYEALTNSADHRNQDTIIHDGTKFIYRNKVNIKPQVIYNHHYILPDKTYDIRDYNKTYRNLSSLGLFRFINIHYSESPDAKTDSSGIYPLDCQVELTPKNIQSYQHEIVGTNSYGDLGVRYNLLYQNLNLFRGAETFNLKFTGAFEALRYSGITDLSRTFELGTETRFEIPKFFLPFRMTEFVKKYSPKTVFALALNHRIEKQYVRTFANASYGYTWRGARYLRHTLFPFELNFVQVDEYRSKDFLEIVDSTFLEYSFTDHLVGVSRYTAEFNTQEIGKIRDFVFIRLNLELAGNSLYFINKLTDSRVVEGSYRLFDVRFSQYARADLEFKYFRVINSRNTMVYRGFAGVGYPYANANSMPFEKKYFVGGPNSIRAWNAYSLGPDSEEKYENTGDIKLEFNMEYRFKLFWKLEGALFMDAGNIWDIYYQESRADAFFKWDRFLTDFAIGTGFGTRFDFSIFLLRIDIAMKMRDPLAPAGERLILTSRKLTFSDDFTVQFGIGYPF
ncbi:MAG: BamA/TamA family outer membrane protein [Bacteroidales bacterium]|nr:BamA/TamA family outer membrane protein [Bacteroidales bacterium]